MIHAYKMNGYNIILDQNSGCVHSVDEATYDIITMYESHTKDEIKKYILEKYKNIDKLTFELVHELIDKVYVGALNLETKEREIDIHWKF